MVIYIIHEQIVSYIAALQRQQLSYYNEFAFILVFALEILFKQFE